MRGTTHTHPAAEFSCLVPVDQIGKDEMAYDLAADAEARQAVAERFGLLELKRLTAKVRLRRVRGGAMLRVSGHFEADVVQRCVITLAPVESHVAEPISLLYCLAPEPVEPGAAVVVEVEDEDAPEPIGPGGLDLGEAVAQQLAVSIDAYPRARDAAVEATQWPDSEAEGATGETPFAVLEGLKRRH